MAAPALRVAVAVTSSYPTRVRAPELRGAGGWLNTGGRELSLAGLRGKIVILDFWTFCCINCLHVLDELRPLERAYADVLVIVGVHSPKFVHEADHDAVRAAVERYGVHHPVLDDPKLTTWRQYAVKAWPTLGVVDPEGYLVAMHAGEGHGAGLAALIERLVAEHGAKGTLHRGDGPYLPPPPPQTELRFPAKVLALPDGTFLVADTGHHSLVQLAADATTVVRRIGSGERGLLDGDPAQARFAEPQGLALLPAEVAGQIGGDVVVADTANHALRALTLATGRVTTLAGTGRPWTARSGAQDLSSPWDVAWDERGQRLWVAMAGNHQLWSVPLAAGAEPEAFGTTNEGLVDGPLGTAWFAQPSGLAVDGDRLWLVDAETSALRFVADGRVRTVAGQGLFDFGHRDGPGGQALLQHPLGVTVLPDGSVAVLDTYNGAVRRYDPAADEVTTLATGLAEPCDAVVVDGRLLVVESAAHRLTRVPLPAAAQRVAGAAYRTARPATQVAAGPVTLDVVFTPPPGQRLDDRYGASTRLVVAATPPELLVEGAGSGAELSRRLVLASGLDGGVLHVTASAAACDEGAEHPACHLVSQDWGVPVRIGAGGERRLALLLRGLG